MNKCFLIGNLTEDPKVSTTSSGIAMCAFTLAVNRDFPEKDGTRKCDFFRCVSWRKTADLCGQYLAKGRKVSVIGSIHFDTFKGKDGVGKNTHQVTVDSVEFLTPKNEQPKDDWSNITDADMPF